MLRRGSLTVSVVPSSGVLVGWCRPKRRLKRRRAATVRLGSRRRGFSLGSRSVVHWGFIRALGKMITELVPNNSQFMEGVFWSLPFLRSQVFPLC